MKKIFTLFLACIVIPVVSQTSSYSLQLFYNINESASAANLARVDSFFNTLPARPAKITITGYADFLNADQYNLALSRRRAELVQAHLQQRPGAAQFTITSTGLGESASQDNGSTEGEPTQRRVDIVADIQMPAAAPATVTAKPVKKQQVVKPVQQAKAPSLETLEEGQTLELEGLSFEPGRHFVVKSSYPVMKKLLETLKDNPSLKIEIQGHICCAMGDDDSFDLDANDYKLSENRAKAVYDYLVRNGISADRLTHKGYGHSMPKVREISPADEQTNRRVEVKVLEH